MACARCSVGPSHHHVSVDHGSSLVERDVATHPDQFVLTIDGNLLVHFALRIEPAHRCVVQGPDSGEMRAGHVILLRKLLQPGINFVALVEDDGILFRRLSRIQQLHLHLGSFARRNGFRRLHILACRILRTHYHGGDPNQYQCNAQSFYFDHRYALLSSRIFAKPENVEGHISFDFAYLCEAAMPIPIRPGSAEPK